MAIIEKRVTNFNCPFNRSGVLVIGSGHARVTKSYYHFLDQLGIESYFFDLSQGLIESLAYNSEKDRTHTFQLIKKTLKKKISQIIIFTDICIDTHSNDRYLAKREKRKAAAISARKQIMDTFKASSPDLLVLSYIITVDGDNQYLDILAEEMVKAGEASV